jgi:hypothetical protein
MKLVMCGHPLDNMREAGQVVAMKRDTFGIGLLLCVVAVVSWLGIMGPLVNDFTKNPYQWFKEFQPLIGATLAGIGLYIAWLNVSRQVAQSREAIRRVGSVEKWRHKIVMRKASATHMMHWRWISIWRTSRPD